MIKQAVITTKNRRYYIIVTHDNGTKGIHYYSAKYLAKLLNDGVKVRYEGLTRMEASHLMADCDANGFIMF